MNAGRAVNRCLKVGEDGRSGAYIVRTPRNLRVFDQLGEIVPDESDVRRPKKVNADQHGVGGDDGADMFRYGLATRIATWAKPAGPLITSPDQHPGFTTEALEGLAVGDPHQLRKPHPWERQPSEPSPWWRQGKELERL